MGSSRMISRGPVGEGLGQLDELLHSQRISAHFAVANFAQSHIEQRFMRAFQRRFRRQASQLRHVTDEADPAHIADERIVLRHVADALPRMLRPVAVGIEAEDAG